MKKKASSDSGFSMMEVVIAILLVAVALFGMAGLTLGIMRYNKVAGNLTVATTLAQEKMEDVQRRGFGGTPTKDSKLTEDYGAIKGYPLFRRVTAVDVDTPKAGMKKVRVQVYWDNSKHWVGFTTFLSG